MKKYLKNISEFIIIFIIIFITFHYILLPVTISGDSMYPTLKNEEISMMDAWHIQKDDIKRFDIVVVRSDVLDNLIIKRVIGLPGEKLVYKDDKLYINDHYCKENYLDKKYVKNIKKEKGLINFTDDFEIQLNNDEIFVLGDNRIVSVDSRVLGPISYNDIKAKNGIVFYPFNEMKWMD